MKSIKLNILFLLACFTTIFVGCSSNEDNPLKSSEKQILTFTINDVKAEISEAEHTIAVILPYGTSTTLTPTISVSKEATVVPNSGKEQDFSNPITYTVTAEDNSKQDYQVTVTILKNSAAKITKFELKNFEVEIPVTLSEENKTITATVPFGTDLKTLVPSITFEGASISPESGKPTNFTEPVTYIVTAENGDTKEYKTTITADKGSAEAKLNSFFLVHSVNKKEYEGKINENLNTVEFDVDFGTDMSQLLTKIDFTPSATINPKSGVTIELNGDNEASYTITAQDGTTKYDFKVKVSQNPFQPLINTVDRTTLIGGKKLQIYGKFSPNDNEVRLKDANGTSYLPGIVILSQSEGFIQIQIPAAAKPGDYKLFVTSYKSQPLLRGTVEYEKSDITITTAEAIAPRIVKMSPESSVKNLHDRIYFTIDNFRNLENEEAILHCVKPNGEVTTPYLFSERGSTEMYIDFRTSSEKLGTYEFYLENDGVRSESKFFELKENNYPKPAIASASEYKPTEGDVIKVTGTNFKNLTEIATYIQIYKASGLSEWGTGGGYASKQKVEAKILSDTELEFVIPFVKGNPAANNDIDGEIGIEVVANGKSSNLSKVFYVKKK